MPKLKTHRGAAKRFKVSGSGKIIKFKAFKSHILEKKSPKRRRNLRKQEVMSSGDSKRVKKLLPYL
ncbi:MAG TPA: 50S ribosomal protein L35 [Firmicutes bacterium]|nr:50S ribosomal protein L35 [Bacillota bacterium]